MAAINDSDGERDRKLYDPDLEEVNPQIRRLLEVYSKVAPAEIVKHVNDIRARGFAAISCPCIGNYRFLNLTLLTHPLYDSIVSRLKRDPSAIYLDLGCCFGQDLRQLVLDGVPSSQLVGLDIEESTFVVVDLFRAEAQGEPWTALVTKGAEVVHCSAFFHLFPLAQQLAAAKIIPRVVRKSGVIVGRRSGSVKPAEIPAIKAGTTSFRHDLSTLAEMWERVGVETETKWEVAGSLDKIGLQTRIKNAVEDENSRRLLFTITRVE